ncbi:transposase zinc-binding domain-containing protein [Thiospirochaeta perfilievii]
MKTVNDILRKYGNDYRKENPFLTIHEKKVMRAIEICRTEELGGRIETCDKCGHTKKVFHSCRNRHCPQCQFMKKRHG